MREGLIDADPVVAAVLIAAVVIGAIVFFVRRARQRRRGE
jgi:hypothetical protein